MSDGPTPKKLGGLALLAQEAVDHAYDNVMQSHDLGLGDTPIERLFFASLSTVASWHHREIYDIMKLSDGYPVEKAMHGARMMGDLRRTAYVQPQVQIAGWRVDFVIHYPDHAKWLSFDDDPPLKRLIVECDGHAYHERTKEQAARDRSRDRVAQYEGLPIFRFTGSELWTDPVSCADEVLAFMDRE